MFLVWRGNGLVAMAAIVAMCVPCVSVIGDKYQPVGALVGGLIGLIGGLLCIRYGRRWNKDGAYHSMYWVPLQAWGYIVLVPAVFGLVTGSVGLLKLLSVRT